MRIKEDFKLGFKDVLIRPKRSILKSRSEVELKRLFLFKHTNINWLGIPIIASNMDTIGTFNMAQVLSSFNMITAINKYYSIKQWQKFIRNIPDIVLQNIMVSTGISDENFDKMKNILSLSSQINFICIDVANGYSERFINFVYKVRSTYPEKIICAGNVVTGEMVEELILSGADIIKIGIGSGSVCTTRMKTGVGYPQLSAIIECADAAHGLKGQIISDGGCTVPGDIAKALGGGADFVMIGGMLAGHDECEGKIIEQDGKKFMSFYGMSSEIAMKTYIGDIMDYRASEGKFIKLPLRGPVKDSVHDILGGLRSACAYIGASKLKELTKRTTFIRVTEQENCVFN